MNFSIRTYRKPVSFSCRFETKGNDVFMVGYDATKENTEYFNRLIIKDGIYDFHLPQSPEVLSIIVFESKEGNVPKSDRYNMSLTWLGALKTQPLVIDTDTAEFIDFAKWFSERAGYLMPVNYYSKSGKFLIKYFDTIVENPNTPSRVHSKDGFIEVSKKWFSDMTIPGRMAILEHEFAHFYLDDETITDNNEIEIMADQAALKLYLKLGYPKVEWVYAWTRIFNDNEAHLERLSVSDINLRNSL